MLDALGASARGLQNTLQSSGSLDESSAGGVGRIRARYIELSSDPGLIGKAKSDLPAVGGLALAPPDACRVKLGQELSSLMGGGSP